MIQLSREPADLPPLSKGPTVPVGRIYVADGDPLAAALRDGDHAILTTASGRPLELATAASVTGTATEPGAYLNPSDLARLSNLAQPRLRLYTWRDSVGKALSGSGVPVLLAGIAAVATALSAMFFLLVGQSEPEVTDRAEAALQWAAGPPPAGAAADRVLAATWCLQRIAGKPAPPASIPGVDCAPPEVPVWRQRLVGSVVSGGVGVFSALLGLVSLRNRFGFQRDPAG